jgi:CRP-like cAMP-binding protein
VAAITREIAVPPRRVLYAEGDPPDGLYIVVSGSILMRRAREAIDRVTANGTFGAWALFDDQPRLTAAEAVEEARVLFVPREEFYDVLSEHVEMVAGLFKHMAQRLRRLASVVET